MNKATGRWKRLCKSRAPNPSIRPVASGSGTGVALIALPRMCQISGAPSLPHPNHHYLPSGIWRLFLLQASLQYFTSSQVLAHFRRHAIGRSQTRQILKSVRFI